jgi:hypothetical protein
MASIESMIFMNTASIINPGKKFFVQASEEAHHLHHAIVTHLSYTRIVCTSLVVTMAITVMTSIVSIS